MKSIPFWLLFMVLNPGFVFLATVGHPSNCWAVDGVGQVLCVGVVGATSSDSFLLIGLSIIISDSLKAVVNESNVLTRRTRKMWIFTLNMANSDWIVI